MGHFKSKTRTCKQCAASWVQHEEKETDVHIAPRLVADAYENRFDRAVLITADSDLAPALTIIKNAFPAKEVFVAAPPGRYNHARSLNIKLEITPGRLAKCLLPETALDTTGATLFQRPQSYTPPDHVSCKHRPKASVMTKNIPPKAIKDLRHLIAAVISDEKAYNVPSVCVRYGLADGGTDEAFSSKYKYVMSRAQQLTADKLLEVAERVHAETENFELGEALAKIKEASENLVSELTRRRIVDALVDIPFSDRISELAFLEKLWPIDTMQPPSGSADVADSMVQYINYQSFLADKDNTANKSMLEALAIYTVSQQQFFKFLEALTDPLARDVPKQTALVNRLNALLSHDGYSLKEVGRLSGLPRFKVQPLSTDSTPADGEIAKALASFSAPDVHERWKVALHRRATDPGAAITSARTLIEDTCKWILHQAGVPFKEDDDLPVLYKSLAKVLNLAPDDHTEQIFKQILGGCASIVTALGSIRNKLGDAHSQGPLRARPLPRHAELAVNLAGSMATFLIATWEAKRAAASKQNKLSAI